MLIFSVSVCLSSQTLRDSSDSLTQGCISGSDIDVCMLDQATDSMGEMYQSVSRLSDGNEMQIGQHSFQLLQQNRASLEYFCFLVLLLVLLLDLYESSSIQQTKRSAIQRGLRGESSSALTLKLFRVSQEFKKKTSTQS